MRGPRRRATRQAGSGENNLLLDGPSDLIYCDVLTEALALQGRAGLDPRWGKICGLTAAWMPVYGGSQLVLARYSGRRSEPPRKPDCANPFVRSG